MNKVRKYPNSETEYIFKCPGCNSEHSFDQRWKFNKNLESPTLSPSYLIKGYLGYDSETKQPIYGICHSFIKEGKIQFLNDCTHNLRGKTVELPECV